MQSDGNFVVYDTQPFRAIWASKTDGNRNWGPFTLTLTNSGDLRISGQRSPIYPFFWDTNTYAGPSAFLYMQDDGNLVLYDSGWHHYWACCK